MELEVVKCWGGGGARTGLVDLVLLFLGVVNMDVKTWAMGMLVYV